MWKAACDLLYSELNGSEYDNNSRIQSWPVAEHSLGDRVAEISKKKIDVIRIIARLAQAMLYRIPSHCMENMMKIGMDSKDM